MSNWEYTVLNGRPAIIRKLSKQEQEANDRTSSSMFEIISFEMRPMEMPNCKIFELEYK